MKILISVLLVLLLLLAAVIVLIGIILILPVTFRVYYNGDEPQYTLKILGIKYKSRKKKLIRIKKNSSSANKSEQTEQRLLDELGDVKRILPPLLKRAIVAFSLKRLDLKIKVSTDDPCDTALMYGRINAAVYATVALLENYLKIKNKNILITADYSGGKTDVECDAVFDTIIAKVLYALVLLAADEIIEISN